MNQQNEELVDREHEPHKAEFSRPVKVADVGGGETTITFEASAGELAALTKRLGVDALTMLNGHAIMQILPDDDVLMKMAFTAQVEQHCVVTLEPIRSDISCEFTTTYGEDGDAHWGHDEENFEDTDDLIEPPEPIIEGKIDIGEACVEQLALEIDPFPRVQGATFDGYAALPKGSNAEAFEKKNPFAALAELKTKK